MCTMDLVQLLVTCATLLLLLQILWSHWSQRSLKLPPGPRGLPLIGHFHLLGRLPHRSLRELSKKYGPIMLLRFGMVPVVVASSPEMAKEVLKTHDAAFASRPYFLVGEHIVYNFKDIALAPYGEHWKNMRKLCATELFTTKRIDSVLWVRMEELSVMISRLIEASQRGKPVVVKTLLAEFIFNVMSRVLMSRTFFGPAGTDVDGKAEEFMQIMGEQAELGLGLHVSEYLPPLLRWLDWSIPRAKKLHLRQDVFLQKIIDEHRLDKHRESTDFTDILLSYFDQEGCKQDDIVKALLVELLPAGTDTSMTAIEWALAELLQNPQVLKKAQNELDSVVGCNRMVEESDFPKLEYLQAVIKEAFRLHPPFTMLVPHMSRQACNVAGYDIPKGATVFVNVHAIGKDPSIWENPSQFLPERFLGKAVDVRGHDFELLPFGSGRRICPGMQLGLKTVQLALANLIHGFDWSFPPGKDGHPMEELCAAVNWMATPLQAMIVPRLPAQAYGKFATQVVVST